jgi:hypothetical protein
MGRVLERGKHNYSVLLSRNNQNLIIYKNNENNFHTSKLI